MTSQCRPKTMVSRKYESVEEPYTKLLSSQDSYSFIILLILTSFCGSPS